MNSSQVVAICLMSNFKREISLILDITFAHTSIRKQQDLPKQTEMIAYIDFIYKSFIIIYYMTNYIQIYRICKWHPNMASVVMESN